MKCVFPLLVGMVMAGNAMADEYLKPEQIQSLLVGKKVIGQVGGGMFDFQMNADKTATTSAAGGDTGTWRFSEDGYCATWTKIRAGVERCFKVSKVGISYFVVAPDGSRTRLVRIDPAEPAAAQPASPVAPAATSAAPAAAQPSVPAAGAVASPAPVPAPAAAAPAQQPQGAEQRLKQAKDLLDKNLITQQQYDEFVARIMKEM
ncbi:MAG: hypothetical protein MUF76_09350 [Hydrogenophaga sp.]|nr:hypothetical protein [Hydrogenophaga sp.]